MICTTCGTSNEGTSKFCIGCGRALVPSTQPISYESNVQPSGQGIQPAPMASNPYAANPIYSNPPSPTASSGVPPMGQSSIQATMVNPGRSMDDSRLTQSSQAYAKAPVYAPISQSENPTKITFGTYFFIMLAVLLKPFTSLKEELHKFQLFQNSAILALIVSAIATLLTLVKTMLSVVIVREHSWLSTKTTTTWVFENLKEINYVKVIGTNFLLYLGIIVVLAGVYYLASLIIKKQLNFSKLVGVATLSMVPFVIGSLLLAPLLTLLYAPLGMIVTLIGGIYAFLIFYETVNQEFQLVGNQKLYVHLICLSVLAVAFYYFYMKFFISSVTSNLDDLFSMFQ